MSVCQWSPSSNETYMPLSVPAKSSPRFFVSLRITRAKLPLGWFVASPSTMRVQRLAVVVRAVDVRRVVADAMQIDDGVGRGGVEVRRLDGEHFAALAVGNARDRRVVPGLAAVLA